MHTPHTPSKNLHRLIMRRVWYSYLISLILSVSAARGFLLGASTVAFFTVVSVADVIQNFLTVKVGDVPGYVRDVFVQAFVSGEFVTLLTLGVLVFSLLSFGLPRPRVFSFKGTQSA